MEAHRVVERDEGVCAVRGKGPPGVWEPEEALTKDKIWVMLLGRGSRPSWQPERDWQALLRIQQGNGNSAPKRPPAGCKKMRKGQPGCHLGSAHFVR